MRALRHGTAGVALEQSGLRHPGLLISGLARSGRAGTLGVALTLLVTVWAARIGPTTALALLLGFCVFVGVLAAFVKAPHVAVAFAIPYFSALPSLKVLVSSQLAPTKDIIEIAAVLAAVILALQRRAARRTWSGDRTLLILTALLIGMYILDIGSGFSGGTRYGVAWFHGVRLVAEPLTLLLVGVSVNDPRRTLRWAAMALIATAYGEALLGLLQQELGGARLVSFGYSYLKQIRTLSGHLRSFGSFDQSFDYATMVAFGMAGVILWLRRGFLIALALPVLALGLAASLVRGAALSVVVLIALQLARKGHTVGATMLLASATAAGVVFMASATQPSRGQVVQADRTSYLTLNGRTKSWRAALGGPETWAFGRGVGHYGTAAERGEQGRPRDIRGVDTAAADSGYLATTSDVGFVGLGVLLALFGRILVLLRRAIGRGEDAAWLGIGIVVVFMLDAALRSSLTGFPSAHVAMLFAGLTLAATSHHLPMPFTRPGVTHRPGE